MHTSPKVEELLDKIKNLSRQDTAVIRKAYDFAKDAHKEQTRFSGEPYFNHVFATGMNLASIGMDCETITAGLLHDTVEDGHVELDVIEKEFSKDIAFLVDGVTKLGKLKYRGVERHVESLRKLFVATAEDPRVIVIKLADRLHNAQTLAGHPRPDKRKRIALETLEIFAPLANRLGIGQLKGQLEDAAFPHVFPKEYKKVKQLQRKRSVDHLKYLEKFHRSLRIELAKHGLKDVQTSYRVKHMYSLFRKLVRKDWDIEKVYDITALRVVVSSVGDCYRVLGIIHGQWRPLPGRIKDYIALPKPNGYQSIHTTVFTGDGGIVEIQIRTAQMHQDAMYGIASHLSYKEGLFERIVRKTRGVKKNIEWIHQLTDWQQHMQETGDYMKEAKMDFFNDRVFVFTPTGDVIDLPCDSTPLDFAYAVHSDIGNHTAAAKINGKLGSIKAPLHNGDIVEIDTKESSHPSRKWLDYVKTTLAKRHIRTFLQKEAKRKK
jgi:GTP pyrophosphokinase